MHSFKVPFHKIFINCKRKNNNFTISEKPDRYDVNHVIKVSITSNEMCQHHASPDMRQRADTVPFQWYFCPPKRAYSELNHDETLDQPKLRIILK